MRKESQTQYPIARCPNRSCNCTIVYSENPKEKSNVTVRIAEPGYKGITYLCPPLQDHACGHRKAKSGDQLYRLANYTIYCNRQLKVRHPPGCEIGRQG